MNVFVDLCDYILIVIVLPAAAAKTALTAGAWTRVASYALAVQLVPADHGQHLRQQKEQGVETNGRRHVSSLGASIPTTASWDPRRPQRYAPVSSLPSVLFPYVVGRGAMPARLLSLSPWSAASARCARQVTQRVSRARCVACREHRQQGTTTQQAKADQQTGLFRRACHVEAPAHHPGVQKCCAAGGADAAAEEVRPVSAARAASLAAITGSKGPRPSKQKLTSR